MCCDALSKTKHIVKKKKRPQIHQTEFDNYHLKAEGGAVAGAGVGAAGRVGERV